MVPHSPPEYSSVNSKTRKDILSIPHKVKGFANDLTIILPSKCIDVYLQIRTNKCVSMVFDKLTVRKASFNIGNGWTRSITDKPTKFLRSMYTFYSISLSKESL